MNKYYVSPETNLATPDCKLKGYKYIVESFSNNLYVDLFITL